MATPTHAEVASNIELLCAWIEAQMAHRAEPGLSIGVVHDQELVWARGFGHAALDDRVAATARVEAGLGPGLPRDARARRYPDRTRRLGARGIARRSSSAPPTGPA